MMIVVDLDEIVSPSVSQSVLFCRLVGEYVSTSTGVLP
jgi:hypothetical protein